MEGLKYVQVDTALEVPDFEEGLFTALGDVARRMKMDVRLTWKNGEKE
jgi:hypothetical protein